MATIFKRKEDRRRKRAKWVIRWFDAESSLWRNKTGYTDKEASEELGRRLEREAARRAEGCEDPLSRHKQRPITEHLNDYIAKVRAGNREDRYVMQLENRTKRIIDGINASRLHDLDPVAIERFLSQLRIKGRKLSGETRNEYVRSIRAFTKWTVEARRIDTDPLVSLKRVERKAIKRTHPRRALSVDEISRLLDAAERRPEVELMTVRHGPDKGALTANVLPEVLKRSRRLGRERRLAYLIALWVGLRRSEIEALVWGDICLDGAVPVIRLRAEATKSRRADTQVIHGQLADELRAFRPDDHQEGDAVLSKVPSMKVIRADLRFAGIDPGTQATGYVDFHALRKTLSTMMAAAGMSQRARQAHMRHTDPRLTENTYMDEALLPIASELAKLPAIPDANDPIEDAIPLQATGTDSTRPQDHAANMQQMCGSKGHFESSPVTTDGHQPHRKGDEAEDRKALQHKGNSTQKHGVSRHDKRGEKKAGDGIRTHDIHVGNVTLYH